MNNNSLSKADYYALDLIRNSGTFTIEIYRAYFKQVNTKYGLKNVIDIQGITWVEDRQQRIELSIWEGSPVDYHFKECIRHGMPVNSGMPANGSDPGIFDPFHVEDINGMFKCCPGLEGKTFQAKAELMRTRTDRNNVEHGVFKVYGIYPDNLSIRPAA